MSNASDAPAPAPAKVLGGVVAYLQVDGASAAADFYKRAFGAVEAFRQPPDEKGRTMHIHLYINNGSVMLSDPYPDYGHPHEKPQGYSLILPVEDVDAWWQRAVDSGAQGTTTPQNMFWGDRYGEVRDPFGVRWAMNGPAK